MFFNVCPQTIAGGTKCITKMDDHTYALMHYLSSSLHMSREQVEGSIVATANMLFGRKWKAFASEEHGTHNNTISSMTNAVRAEQYIETMALSIIVDEIMPDDSFMCCLFKRWVITRCHRRLGGSISYCRWNSKKSNHF